MEKGEIEQSEREYIQLVAEGRFEDAAALRTEINEALKTEARTEATEAARAEGLRGEQQRAFDKVVASVLEDYPYLDDKGDEADEDAIERVVAFRNYFISTKKLSPADALRKAADRVAEARAREMADEDDAQPASTRRRGRPVTHTDVARMDDEEFAELSEADLRRLRGD